MSTPEIERELFKYGLKSLQRPKAVRVLNYLFETMHPYVVIEERKEDANIQLGELESIPTASQGVRKKLSESEALQRQILRYEPINLDDIYGILKDGGLRYETNDLIAFLDKYCITFRTAASSGDRTAKVKPNPDSK
uniref:Structure-specific endonuclease subunit SLX4 n=1 Tax=Anopheles merus TaxID=30066 RepID=A0A182UUV9_ANOME